jgi:hypothetical protein
LLQDSSNKAKALYITSRPDFFNETPEKDLKSKNSGNIQKKQEKILAAKQTRRKQKPKK